uniref:Uncharacterized protein n=1 Tax=Streptomyces sp. NBC_00008 TaxID=2903610 RepID=A0AAU2W1H5_9ACTN
MLLLPAGFHPWLGLPPLPATFGTVEVVERPHGRPGEQNLATIEYGIE